MAWKLWTAAHDFSTDRPESHPLVGGPSMRDGSTVLVMRDGVPLPGTTPPAILSQLTYRIFGPLRINRVRTMLDYHGLAGLPAASASIVAGRHGITTPTLRNWSKTLTTAGSRLPLSVELATELARSSRPSEDHLGRVRAAITFGLTAPQPPTSHSTVATTPNAPTGLSASDRGAAGIAIRVLAAVGPLSISTLHRAVARNRRTSSLPLITTQQLASALRAVGVMPDDQDVWRAPGDVTAPDRYQALVEVAAGRVLTRLEMIDALRLAGYAQTSASVKTINRHPLIHRDGPNQYGLVRDSEPDP